LVRAAKEMVAAAPSANRRLLDAAGGDVERISGPEVTKAAADGDPTATKCLEEIGHWLGRGLASMAAVLDPGRFVVGGGVSDAGDLLLGPARKEFEAALPGRGHRPVADVVVAALGAEAGIVGAADLARR
jgi:glucokinase